MIYHLPCQPISFLHRRKSEKNPKKTLSRTVQAEKLQSTRSLWEKLMRKDKHNELNVNWLSFSCLVFVQTMCCKQLKQYFNSEQKSVIIKTVKTVRKLGSEFATTIKSSKLCKF